MASPDFREYIDLTLYDVEPEDIYAQSVEYAKTALPEFSPRVGTVEDAVLQAVSYSTAVAVAAINRLPDGLMEGIAKLMGISRNEATFASGTVQFYNQDFGTPLFNDQFGGDDVLIPAGTVLEYIQSTSDAPISYLFETTSDILVPVGATAQVPIIATTAGRYPSLLNGQDLTILSSFPTITSSTLVGNLFRGADSETDAEYFERVTAHLASLNQSLATASQMTQYIRVNYPDVIPFKVWDLTDFIEATAFDHAQIPGYVSISGAITANAYTNAMLTDLAQKSYAGLTFRYLASVPQNIDVSLIYTINNKYTEAEVNPRIIAAVQSFLSAENFVYRYIPKNELISIISNVEGVYYVTSLDMTTTGSGFSVDVDGGLVYLDKLYVPTATVTVQADNLISF